MHQNYTQDLITKGYSGQWDTCQVEDKTDMRLVMRELEQQKHIYM